MNGYPFPPDLVQHMLARRDALHCFERLDPARTALLVVDMQAGFLDPRWPTALASAREIVPTVNLLAEALRRAGGEVVWIGWEIGPDPADRWNVFFDHVLGAEAGRTFRTLFAPGHQAQKLWPGLEVRAGEAVIGKTNFSGFSGSRGRLERHLRDRGRDTVLVAGTVTAVCCESTAREAAFADFKTIMIADANAGRSDAENLHVFSTFLRVFGDVMTAAEVIDRLQPSTGAAVPRGATAPSPLDVRRG